MEVLLTVFLLGIMLTFAVPEYRAYQLQVDMDGVSTVISQSIRTAQVYAQGPIDDSKWGIFVTDTSTILFKGDDYITRDQTEDLVYKYPKVVVISGLNEIIFSKYEGLPNASGNIIFQSEGQTKQIFINEKGQIQ